MDRDVIQDETSTLVRRAAEGDQEAWDTLVVRYSGLLWAVVRRFRLDDEQAADVLQTTWLRLVENIGSIRDPARLPGWLATTARRRCLDAVTASARQQPIADGFDPPTPDSGPEASVLQSERNSMVRRALDRLPERDRALLTMLVADPPRSYEEISARLRMPVGSIGPTRARALRRLRGELEASHLVDAALG
jgi:RNA polymerase sigma factor (sigma-70 family)